MLPGWVHGWYRCEGNKLGPVSEPMRRPSRPIQSCGNVRCSELPGSAVTTSSAAPPKAAVACARAITPRATLPEPRRGKCSSGELCHGLFRDEAMALNDFEPDAIVAEAVAVHLHVGSTHRSSSDIVMMMAPVSANPIIAPSTSTEAPPW